MANQENPGYSKSESSLDTDPVLTQSVRLDRVVELGLSPSFEDTARLCAQAYITFKSAEKSFKIAQKELRDYGSRYINIYNHSLHENIKTVKIPFRVKNSSEIKMIQVTNSSSYSINQDRIMAMQSHIGNDHFQLLFNLTRSKVHKPDFDASLISLISALFVKSGVNAAVQAEFFNDMNKLYTDSTTVSVTESYEQALLGMPGEIQKNLKNLVRRFEPALKFQI
ncbi:MAG TPA: hypothetical protein ENI61_00495 [Ignavibacteria bacterium]|nr:hypothetical protein [Ignavibacteria bacterium]